MKIHLPRAKVEIIERPVYRLDSRQQYSITIPFENLSISQEVFNTLCPPAFAPRPYCEVTIDTEPDRDPTVVELGWTALFANVKHAYARESAAFDAALMKWGTVG